MHDRLDKSNQTTDWTVYQSWGIGIFVLPVLLAAFLAGLAIIRPDVSRWVSESEQAELVGAGLTMGGIPAQVAPPAREVRTVKVN
jgi:hypothetical protein